MTGSSKSEKAVLGIVGIGASAGGLEALTAFVSNVPLESGLCFVVVQHLAPDHPSMMDQLLAHHTKVKVIRIEDGMQAAPNTIFVIPPGSNLTINDGTFNLAPRDQTEGLRTPIDKFLVSLAEDAEDAAACVILSGTGRDGTAGLRAIKSHGGVAIVQNSESARFAGMPESASATGIVDFVLKPERIPERLVDVMQHRKYLKTGADGERLRNELTNRLPEILRILADEDGHDFGDYKEGTLLRRVERRMVILRLSDVDEMIELLQQNREERQTLLHDFLIGVTRFFRDEEVFGEIREKVIPEILERDQQEFRIWVPGCSTGEEAYSLAILFQEAMRKAGDRRKMQVFGTDVDLNALRHARAGRYGPGALQAVDRDLIDRYFRHEDEDFVVKPVLRENVVFAPHNVLTDPPFSRIDLVSCRNLLIYLNRDGQKGVLSRFHYALRQSGALVLGPSESIGDHEAFFDPIVRQHRIFRRDNRRTMGYSALDVALDGPRPTWAIQRAASPVQHEVETPDRTLDENADQFFLTRFSPPYVVIDARNQVRYLSANSGALIGPPKGQPTSDLDGMLSRDLRVPVRKLLDTLRREGGPVRGENILVQVETEQRVLDVEIDYLPDDSGQAMIAFLPVRLESGTDLSKTNVQRGSQVAEDLQHELDLTRRTLSATQSDFESAEQELRSANEELLSMNEELQSSNEELETSREELQSINEELETINAELTENNKQLASVNGDLQNVLESTDIPTLILGDELELRRFTHAARNLFSMDDRDIGRPISDLSMKIEYPELKDDVASVHKTLQMVEREVTDLDGATCYQVRVRPYRGVDDRLDGSVITFVDITQRLRFETELRESEQRLSAALSAGKLGIFEADLRTGELIWDETSRRFYNIPAGEKIDANLAFSRFHPEDREATERAFYDLADPNGSGKLNSTFRLINPEDGKIIWVHAEGSVIYDNGKPARVVGVNKDVTEEYETEARLRDTAARLELTYEVTGIAAYEWNVEKDESIWTPNMFDILGCPRDRKPSFTLFDEFIHPDDREPVGKAVEKALKDGSLFDMDFRIRHGTTGAERVLNGKGRAIHDEYGRVISMIGINYDRTEAVRDEEHRKLLTKELNHRVKNSLATIQSIARQTVRSSDDMDTFSERFLGRLQAIGRAHDILVNENETDTTISALIQTQVRPYAGNSDAQLRLSGPAIRLDASVAHSLGLVLHELATNASKYGALSAEVGMLEIEWKPITLDQRPGLELIWRETGGPEVKAPETNGFGTRLIETSLSHALGGSADMDFAATGLVATIKCYSRIENE